MQSLQVEALSILTNTMGKLFTLDRFVFIMNVHKSIEHFMKTKKISRICFFVQSNNAYIFPGFGLGLVMSGAIRVHNDMLLAACKFTHHKTLEFSCLTILNSFILFLE